jgi:urease accessory protein
MPIGASALAYASGFVLATAVLHGIGIALGFALARTPSQRLIQAAGCGTALAGMVLFAKLI